MVCIFVLAYLRKNQITSRSTSRKISFSVTTQPPLLAWQVDGAINTLLSTRIPNVIQSTSQTAHFLSEIQSITSSVSQESPPFFISTGIDPQVMRAFYVDYICHPLQQSHLASFCTAPTPPHCTTEMVQKPKINETKSEFYFLSKRRRHLPEL